MKLLPALLLFTLQSFASFGPDVNEVCGAYPPPPQGTYYSKCDEQQYDISAFDEDLCGSFIVKGDAAISNLETVSYPNYTFSRIYLLNNAGSITYNMLVKPYAVHLIEYNNCEAPDSIPLPKFDSTLFVLPDSIPVQPGDTVFFKQYCTSYKPVYMSINFEVIYSYLTSPDYSITVNGTTYLPTVISSSPKPMQNSLRSTKYHIRFYNLLGQKR